MKQHWLKPFSPGSTRNLIKKALLAFLITGSLLACKQKKEDQEKVLMPAELPEGFTDFYQRFLTDSLFQMEHILFPLQGLPNKADSSLLGGNDFRWEMDKWVMHRPIDKGSGFFVNLKPVTDTYVLEEIIHESGNFGMERRFAFMDDGWYLIYYAGLNSLRSE